MPQVTAQSGYPYLTDRMINDYAQIITLEDQAKIRTLYTNLKNNYGIEAVVVTIKSIDTYSTPDRTIESFATNLFNTRGIGNATTNKGVLTLVSVGDRKVRIELGSGYGSTYNAKIQTVIEEYMLPSFKKGNYSHGIYQGSRAIIQALTGSWPESFGTTPIGTQPTTIATQVSPDLVDSPPVSSSQSGLAWILGGGGIASAVGLNQYLRYRKRQCPHCKSPMTRLDEASDDLYLDSGQRAEEMLNSVDYDVWKCPNCNYHQILRYSKWSSFKQCPLCSYKTLSTNSQTIVSPTYESSGYERVTETCRNCSFHRESTVVLPQLQRSESGSSSGYSHSYDRDNSSSYDRDNSSDGESSGGGATGGW
jgi:uncharacterized protein